eukprot:gene33577-43164_t
MGMFWNSEGVSAATRAAVAAVRDECGYAYAHDWAHIEDDACHVARMDAEYMLIANAAWDSVYRAAA